jgi:hypothetical protein
MYKYYNANPKNLLIDDCVLRSISVAEGISWNECQRKLSYLANEEAMLLNDVEFVENYLDERYPRECCKDMTIGEFCKICPKGHFVVTTRGHITAIIDNVIVDTFDCSNRIMWCCWKIM